MVCRRLRKSLSLGCQAGKFSPPDGPFDWVWESVGRTRRRQDVKKNKSHNVCRYMATGFLRDLTCRFKRQPKVHSGTVWVTIASLPRLKNCPWPQHAATLQVEVCLRFCLGGV
jgi:hypothetical protein